ncbi:hypothetical protein [Nostoc phage NMeng1]|nr:hypothetical protein [Nostoc phage NMeng1]
MSTVVYTGLPGKEAAPGQFDPGKQAIAEAGAPVSRVPEVRGTSGAPVAGMPATARARASVRMGKREGTT